MKPNLQEYTRRLHGIISDHFHGKTIATIGTGAGSYAVEKLARFSPKKLKNVDRDRIQTENLCRTSFTTQDVGKFKVDALEDRIRAINPFVQVESFPKDLHLMTPDELDNLLAKVDLLVAGTDEFSAQARINELAVERGIPAVFIGVHQWAAGGRIITYLPGQACYRCIARERYEAPPGEVDLPATTGCIVDCQAVDMTALKVSLAVLERGQSSRMGRFHDTMRGRNDIVFRTDSSYEWGNLLWDAVLGDLPRTPIDYAAELKRDVLHAMDSLWFKRERDPQCPVCSTR